MQPEKSSYDFILDPSQPQKSGGNFGGGKKKIIPIIIFLSFIMVVLIIGFTLISSIGKVNNQDLMTVRAQQTELLRVIEMGQKGLGDIAIRNQLASLEASVASDGKQIADLLKGRDIITTNSTLNSLKDKDIDAAFDAAKQDGTYDQVVLSAVSERSTIYFSALKLSLSEATSNLEKRLLQTAIDNLQLSIQ